MREKPNAHRTRNLFDVRVETFAVALKCTCAQFTFTSRLIKRVLPTPMNLSASG